MVFLAWDPKHSSIIVHLASYFPSLHQISVSLTIHILFFPSSSISHFLPPPFNSVQFNKYLLLKIKGTLVNLKNKTVPEFFMMFYGEQMEVCLYVPCVLWWPCFKGMERRKQMCARKMTQGSMWDGDRLNMFHFKLIFFGLSPLDVFYYYHVFNKLFLF